MENWETPSLPTKIFAPLFSPLLLPLFLHTPIKLARISTSGIRARLPVPLSESLPLLVSPLSPSLPLRRRSAAPSTFRRCRTCWSHRPLAHLAFLDRNRCRVTPVVTLSFPLRSVESCTDLGAWCELCRSLPR
jgi:hypothetical protein